MTKTEDEYKTDLLELMSNWEYMEHHEPADWPYEEILNELKSLIASDRWTLKCLREHIREEE